MNIFNSPDIKSFMRWYHMQNTCAISLDITLPCIDSAGGLLTIYVNETDNIASMTVAAGALTVITNTVGKKFRKYALARATAEATSTLSVDQATGTRIYKEAVMLVVNTLSAAMSVELPILMANRITCVAVDRNGNGWLFGKQYGLTGKEMKVTTGKAGNDRNGYDLSLEGEEVIAPLYVSAAVIATLQTVGS